MGLFHFDQVDGDQWTEDSEGQDCFDLADARRVAFLGVRELVVEQVRSSRFRPNARFDIRDDQGVVLGKVLFSEALA